MSNEDNVKKYDGWLVSNSFVKRALAVYGYSIVGSLIVFIPLIIIFIVLSFMIIGDNAFDGGYSDDLKEAEMQRILENMQTQEVFESGSVLDDGEK